MEAIVPIAKLAADLIAIVAKAIEEKRADDQSRLAAEVESARAEYLAAMAALPGALAANDAAADEALRSKFSATATHPEMLAPTPPVHGADGE